MAKNLSGDKVRRETQKSWRKKTTRKRESEP